MPLLCFKCKICGAIAQIFDDEAETPPQTSDDHICEWERVDNLEVATYTKAYQSQYPQWDNIFSADYLFKEANTRGDKERHEKKFHEHSKK